MFVGRECYRYTQALSKLQYERDLRQKASPKWLQPWLKLYVYLFGIPDVGLQLRARYSRRVVRRFQFSRVLDAGCGIGINSLYLAKRYPSTIIDGCDANPDLVQAAGIMRDKQKIGNVNFFEADLTQFSAPNKYDLLLCIEVIEHITDDSLTMRNFSNVLKDNGVLVLSTRHARNVERRIKGWKRDNPDHVREGYTDDQLCQLLQSNGFEIEEIRHTWGFWGEYCDEIYYWVLRQLPLPFAALSFPLLSAASSLDMLRDSPNGYGLLVVARKNAK